MSPFDDAAIAARLAELGLQMPPPPPPSANYVGAVQEGKLLFVSGQGPVFPGGYHHGKVGAEVSIEQAYEHARVTTLNLLSVMRQELGSLSRVRRIVKILGMVNAAPDFVAHPLVINGCSDLLVSLFGEHGRHARSAVGMGSLPGQITVEIELIAAID
ncbi:RidA family protein [Sphingomonas sp. RP10(2022)]|uniref:RidA family protein n=1 Tax=Sphingomonas liriopis TaxID=2949094 RepID=A0A9X2HQL0_9SPHN|nr:RidA family protein [Sphingomonas liriopis]